MNIISAFPLILSDDDERLTNYNNYSYPINKKEKE